MKIVFTGGGSGGHIFPILAIVRQLNKLDKQNKLRMYYIGPDDSYATSLLEREGVRVKKIVTGKLRRYFSFKNFIDIFKLPIGIIQAFFWIFAIAPDLVFSKSGHGSFPAALASEILAVPLFLHESDSEPGLASRMESKWALEIFISFQKTGYFPKDKRIWVGNPIREDLLENRKEIREQAKRDFEIRGDKPVIFIMGGSQGAQRINEAVLEILPDMISDFEVIHQTGEKNYKSVEAEGKAVLFQPELVSYYHPVPFLNEKGYKEALNISDLVISRAGAGAIFEIAALEKPSILIPLTQAQDHQLKNAYNYSNYGACEVLEQENMTPHFLLETMRYIFKRPEMLMRMKRGAYEFSRPKAAGIIASYLYEYLMAKT